MIFLEKLNKSDLTAADVLKHLFRILAAVGLIGSVWLLSQFMYTARWSDFNTESIIFSLLQEKQFNSVVFIGTPSMYK